MNAPAGATPLTFTNVNASNDAAQSLTITSQSGTVTITGPTAASVSVSGRVVTSNGAGIAGAAVTLLKTVSGETLNVTTDTNGMYVFEGVAVGADYIVTPQAVRYTFNPTNRYLSLVEEVTTVDFVGARKRRFR